MSQQQIGDMVAMLYQRTKEGRLEWESTNKADMFVVTFPDYAIALTGSYDEDNDLVISLTIYDDEAKVVDKTNNYILHREGNIDLQDFLGLYELARRTAMGQEKAIRDIMGYLEKIAPISDDIPF